jgi:hypothetical protein
MMMRAVAVSVMGLALIASAALAQEGFSSWTDPSGRLTFMHPPSWQARSIETQNADAVRAFTGNASFECQIWLLPREQTASWPEDRVRQHYTQALPANTWTETFGNLRMLHGELSATEISVDTTTAWPTQHATLRASDGQALVSLQGRVGFELISLCQAFDGQDHASEFNAIAASVDTPTATP